MTLQDSCQFAPNATRGSDALGLAAGGAQGIAVMVSPNQATALKAGDAVRFDTAQDRPGLPWVILAGVGDTAHGIIKKTVKQATFVANQVADMQTNIGPFSVQEAAATCAPGNVLETTSGGTVQPKNTGAAKYMSIDYATVGQTLRVALLPVSA